MKTKLKFLLFLLPILSFGQEVQTLYTKKAPLTEQELKRWSHLDLEKDTIPGMSVDKAYNELLKNKKKYSIHANFILRCAVFPRGKITQN